MSDVKDTDAIILALKTIIDIANDVLNVVDKKKASYADFTNLFADLLQLAPKILEIPDEVKSLSPTELSNLAGDAAKQLNLPGGDHSKAILDAALVVFNTACGELTENILKLVDVIRTSESTASK